MTVWLSVALAAVVAFELFVAADEAQPAGTRSAFTIEAVDTPTKDEALDAVAQAADAVGRNVFKVQPDARDSMRGRTLFAFVGDDVAFEARGGFDYPTFSTLAMRTRVLPAQALTTEDPRGRYVTDASRGELDTMLTVLARAGVTARDDTVPTLGLLVYAVGRGNLAGAFAVMVLALGLAVSYSVASHRKVFALKALHGYRRIDEVRAELVSATVVLGAGAGGLLVVVVPFLGLYNGFRQAPGFLRMLAMTMLVLYLVLATLVVIAVWSLPRLRTPLVLKGERTSLRNGVLAGGAQVLVLAIVLATTSGALNRIEAVNESLDSSSHWSTGQALYALRLSVPASTQEDQRRAGPGLAEVVDEMESDGQVLLAAYQPAEEPLGNPGGVDETGQVEPFIVNNAYLDRQVVNDIDGRRITGLIEQSGAFTLLVPSSYDGDRQVLLAAYTRYLGDFTCQVGRDGDAEPCDARGKIVDTAAEQDLFTYTGTEFMPAELQSAPTSLHDPIVAVVPAASGLISPLMYVSYASQDALLFADANRLDVGLTERGVRGYFQGIDNAADAVNASVALAQRELRMDAFSLAIGWAVLVLSSIVMVTVYCDRRKRPMFVELIHGYRFTVRHWRYLTMIVLLSAIGAGIAGLTGGSLSRPRDLTLAGLFIAAQLTVALAAIRIYESRFRADFIKRY